MRFALSAAAAASGLLLLGLALFGQPDVYLRQAREALDNLGEPAPPAPDQAPGLAAGLPAASPSVASEAADQPAASQRSASQAAASQPAASQPAASQPVASQPVASEAAVSQPVASQPVATPVVSQPVASPPAAASQPNAAITASVEQLQQQVLQLRDELATRREEADRAREALALAQAQQQAAQAQQQAAEAQAQQQAAEAQRQVAEAQRHAAEAQRQAAEQLPAITSGPSAAPSRGATETPPPLAADRHEPPNPAERHAAASKPILPVKPAPRLEAENAQSVLARLRQAAPVTAAPTDAAQPPERINRGPSPALRRLIAARTALGNGQVEETRRLLQEAQLQLVFRPVGSADEETGSPGRTASNVAHALDALSGNDIALSRSYIDRAVDDASGPPADPAHGETSEPPMGYEPGYAPGYAPAYPVR